MADLNFVRQQALQLDPDARASLVDEILESLDLDSTDAATQAWLEEVRRRRREVHDGSVALLSGEELFRGLD